MLRVAFDIGGVLSKDKRWRTLALSIQTSPYGDNEVYVITDMHDKNVVLQTLEDNDLDFIPPERVYCANYEQYGEACKAVLLKELQIDIFFDDFIGYLQWDSQLGLAPLRCLVMPDMFQPYWHQRWKVQCEDGGSVGRWVTPINLSGNI